MAPQSLGAYIINIMVSGFFLLVGRKIVSVDNMRLLICPPQLLIAKQTHTCVSKWIVFLQFLCFWLNIECACKFANFEKVVNVCLGGGEVGKVVVGLFEEAFQEE